MMEMKDSIVSEKFRFEKNARLEKKFKMKKIQRRNRSELEFESSSWKKFEMNASVRKRDVRKLKKILILQVQAEKISK